jgi:hypothetical protein
LAIFVFCELSKRLISLGWGRRKRAKTAVVPTKGIFLRRNL